MLNYVLSGKKSKSVVSGDIPELKKSSKAKAKKRKSAVTATVSKADSHINDDDDALLLSDQDVPAQSQPTPKSKDGPVPKKSRLSLEPQSSVAGGFDTALMAQLVATQLSKILPQAVSQHYDALISTKRQEEEQQDSEEDDENGTSSEEEQVSEYSNPQLPTDSQTDLHVFDRISAAVSHPVDDSLPDGISGGLKELIHFVNHTNGYKPAVSTPPVVLMRSSVPTNRISNWTISLPRQPFLGILSISVRNCYVVIRISSLYLQNFIANIKSTVRMLFRRILSFRLIILCV